MEVRSDFTRLGALGATGTIDAITLPKVVSTSTAPRAVSIVGIVNAVQSLADGTLAGNIFWIDNNAAGGSKFLGTDHLVSAIEAGANVTWMVEPLEVETFIEILDMTGPVVQLANATEVSEYSGALKYWKGQVASSGQGDYTYSFSLNVGGRKMALPANLTLAVTGNGGPRK